MLSEFVSNCQEHQNAEAGQVKRAKGPPRTSQSGTTHQARVTTSVKGRTCHQVSRRSFRFFEQQHGHPRLFVGRALECSNCVTSWFCSRIDKSSSLIGRFLIILLGLTDAKRKERSCERRIDSTRRRTRKQSPLLGVLLLIETLFTPFLL
jgi:hypothetical protein